MFLVTNSISLINIELYRFSMFPVSVLATFLRNLFHQSCWYYSHEVFIIFPCYPFNICMICNDIPSLVTDLAICIFSWLFLLEACQFYLSFQRIKFCFCKSLLFVFHFGLFLVIYFSPSTTLWFHMTIFFYIIKAENYATDFKSFLFLLI